MTSLEMEIITNMTRTQLIAELLALRVERDGFAEQLALRSKSAMHVDMLVTELLALRETHHLYKRAVMLAAYGVVEVK